MPHECRKPLAGPGARSGTDFDYPTTQNQCARQVSHNGATAGTPRAGVSVSYRIVKEVRTALRTGRVKLTGRGAALDRLLLVLIADDCHDDTRRASVGMAELSEITDVHRTTLWRSIRRLEAAGCLRVVEQGRRAGAHGKASVYEIPADLGGSQ